MTDAAEAHTVDRSDRLVILASSVGTVIAWQDFYLYGSLAAIITVQFFSGVNETTGYIFALMAFAAGFAVRPFGAIVFGRLGDVWGRKNTGYPPKPDSDLVNKPLVVAILFVLVMYVTMVYGPITAALVEMFPTNIRYTTMSLPYHVGNGWIGGFLPTTPFAMVAATGNIYYGLWYPGVVALVTVVVGFLFIRDRKDVDIHA